jgi:hypothetical protein
MPLLRVISFQTKNRRLLIHSVFFFACLILPTHENNRTRFEQYNELPPYLSFVFSTNDTLLINGTPTVLEDGKIWGDLNILHANSKTNLECFSPLISLDVKFQNDTVRMVEYEYFLNLVNDRIEFEPYIECLFTSDSSGITYSRRGILRVPEITLNDQRDFIKNCINTLKNKELQNPAKYHQAMLKNVDKLFYCAMLGNKEAKAIFENYEQIIRQNNLWNYYIGEHAELYHNRLSYYNKDQLIRGRFC